MSDPKKDIIITEHNYEEYFLLYTDGELTKEEMNRVDAFVTKNPAYLSELQAMLDLRLSPDDDSVAFSFKQKLLKPVPWDEENPGEEQVWLLNAIDGEADSEKPVALNEADAERELSWLRQAKLEPEAVVMPHKYRLIRLGEWDADNLSPEQESWLETLHSGMEIPPGIVGNPAKMAEWNKLKHVILQSELVAMPGKEKLYHLLEWDAENLTEEQQSLLDLLAENGQLSGTSDAAIIAEWNLLQSTILPPEQLEMPGKASLYRFAEWNAEKLTAAQATMLEALENGSGIPDDGDLTEWARLQQTILPQENIEMPGKQKLYRLAEWNAEELTAAQAAILDALENGESMPEGADATEWNVLQQTVLPHEEIIMPGKHRLFHTSVWEDDLTAAQWAMLEALEEGGPMPEGANEAEWQLLQETVLPVEEIQMPDRHRLYKENAEKPLAPVISIPWRKVAAVAATFIAIFWLGFQVYNNGDEVIASAETPVVITPGVDENNATNSIAAQSETGSVPSQNNMVASANASENERAKRAAEYQNTPAPNTSRTQRVLLADNSNVVNNRQQNQEPLPTVVPVQYAVTSDRQVSGEFRPASQTVVIETKSSPNNTRSIEDLRNGAPEVAAALPLQKVIIPDLEEDMEDKYININGVRIEKQKLRSVVRPITRRINRTFEKSEVAPVNDGTRLLR